MIMYMYYSVNIPEEKGVICTFNVYLFAVGIHIKGNNLSIENLTMLCNVKIILPCVTRHS